MSVQLVLNNEAYEISVEASGLAVAVKSSSYLFWHQNGPDVGVSIPMHFDRADTVQNRTKKV